MENFRIVSNDKQITPPRKNGAGSCKRGGGRLLVDLMFLPFGIFPNRVPRNVAENMVKNLYCDILNDPKLKYKN